jgi:hypothetical protein
MPTSAASPASQRDLRIDFFRGLALVFIFIDHIPQNGLAHFTLRNFGFSDAAEVFVLLAGFSAVLAYGRTFEGQGFRAGASRVADRVRDIYLWHLGLLLVCAVGLTAAATAFGQPMYVNNIGVQVFSQDPVRAAVMTATLVNQPNTLNILPLYIVLLMFWLPLVLWLIPRWPVQTVLLSVAIWGLANAFGLNLPSHQHPKGWVFNPLAWQLLITIGALAAHNVRRGTIPYSRWLLWPAVAYVVFAFLAAAPWTLIAGLEGYRVFPANMLTHDKTYLTPWRLMHVVALGYLALILLSPQSQWLSHAWARGIGRCGRHSLEVFCLGTALSFAGWVVLAEAGNGLVTQILVNSIGIGILWGTAWALAQRKSGADEFVFAAALRKHFSQWRSQEQQV